MDCRVHGVTKSQTQLSDFHFTFSYFLIILIVNNHLNTVLLSVFHKFGFLHKISQNWTVPGLNFMPCQNSKIGIFTSAPQNMTAF